MIELVKNISMNLVENINGRSDFRFAGCKKYKQLQYKQSHKQPVALIGSKFKLIDKLAISQDALSVTCHL